MVPIHTVPPPSILISTPVTYLIINAELVMFNNVPAVEMG
jgi:hypothetical protein